MTTTIILPHETAEGPQDRAAWQQLLATAPRSTDSARPSSSRERYSTVRPSKVTRVVPPVKAAASTDARVPAGCASAQATTVGSMVIFIC